MMSPETPADRWAVVAEGFTRRVTAVDVDGWDRPTPCEGWVARDIVRHLVEWVPPLLTAGAGIDISPLPDVDEDPVAAWMMLADRLAALLDDPTTAAAEFDHPHAGKHRLDDAIEMFILNDVAIHTWDLARATDGDEQLDAATVERMLPGMEAMGDMLAASGHYAPPVHLEPGADAQSRLLAATGRDPR